LTRDDALGDVGACAPQPQPDVTEDETTGEQALGMGHSDDDTGRVTTQQTEELPDLDPWRQVGWIFHEDGCVAIARQGEVLRSGVLAD
jgi:hypothetical protein